MKQLASYEIRYGQLYTILRIVDQSSEHENLIDILEYDYLEACLE